MTYVYRGSQLVLCLGLGIAAQACNTGNEAVKAGGSASQPLLAKAIQENSEVSADGNVTPPAIGSDLMAKLDSEEGRAEVEAMGWIKDENGAAVRYDAVRNQWDKVDQAPPSAETLNLSGFPFYSTWSAEAGDEQASEEVEGFALDWRYGRSNSLSWRTVAYTPIAQNTYRYNPMDSVRQVSARYNPIEPVRQVSARYNPIEPVRATNTSPLNIPVVSDFHPPSVQVSQPVVTNYNPPVNNTVQYGQGNITVNNNNGAASGCWPSYSMFPNGSYRVNNPCPAGWATGAGSNINIITNSNTSSGSFNNVNSNVNTGFNTGRTTNYSSPPAGENHRGAWDGNVANCRQQGINQCGRLPNYYWHHANGYCQINC